MNQQEIIAKKVFSWKLTNFTKVFAEGGGNRTLTSEVVSMPFGKENTEWYLCMKIEPERDDGLISIFLCLKFSTFRLSNGFSTKVQFGYSISSTGDVYKDPIACDRKGLGKGNVFQSWGDSSFVSLKQVFSANSGFIANNSFTVLCKLELLASKRQSLQETQSSMSSDFANLFGDATLADLRLVMKDDIVFEVHRVILAARSPVFHKMISLRKRTGTGGFNAISIADVDSRTMKELLRFMYCDEVKNLDKVAAKLVFCAEKYDMPQLKKICCDFLVSKLSVKNILQNLQISSKIKDEALFDGVVNFLTKNRNWEKYNRIVSKYVEPEMAQKVFAGVMERCVSVVVETDCSQEEN